MESSHQGVTWGEAQPPLWSWDTETQSSPLQRSRLLKEWIQEVWLGGIIPVAKSKLCCFHKLVTCASFPGNTDLKSVLGALGASLSDRWAISTDVPIWGKEVGKDTDISP